MYVLTCCSVCVSNDASNDTSFSLRRGVIVINATLSFELHPEEEKHEKEEEGSGEMEEGWMHVIYPTHPETSESRDCGVSHTSIPPIQIIPHTHRVSMLCVFTA